MRFSSDARLTTPKPAQTERRLRKAAAAPAFDNFGSGTDERGREIVLRGFGALREIEPRNQWATEDALPLTLWLSLRNVHTWSKLTVEERAGFFSELRPAGVDRLEHARKQAPQLSDALVVFTALLREPQLVLSETLASACMRVSGWAADLALARTATLFAEAAAAASPLSAEQAIEAGRACMREGGAELLARAEQWFRRALGLARHAPESRVRLVIRSLLACGEAAKELGRYEDARALYEQALRRARNQERPRLCAISHHYLFALLAETGDLHNAEAHARAALDHYPARDTRLPHLAHDYAFALLRRGLHRHAFQILQHLPLAFRDPHYRLLGLGLLAHAAGACGRRDEFLLARDQVLALEAPYRQFAPAALLQTAEGARALADWSQAERLTSLASRAAKERADFMIQHDAELLLGSVSRREPHAQVVSAERDEEAVTQTVSILEALLNPTGTAQTITAGDGSKRPVREDARVPAAPAWNETGASRFPAGSDALREVATATTSEAGDALALVLWLSLRKIRDSQSIPGQDRVDRQHANAAARLDRLKHARKQVPQLADALAVLTAMLRERHRIEPPAVSAACMQVSRWAADLALARTATLFAEAAAAASPLNAEQAIEAGRACMREGGAELLARAEQWFRRALGLARRSKESRTLLVIRSLLACGDAAKELGRHEEARSFFEQAVRRARNQDRNRYCAISHHHLFALLAETGDFQEAEAHARAALDFYPRRDSRLPHLAHDYAFALVQRGLNSQAFQLLRRLPAAFKDPHYRLLALGILARVSATCGRRDEFLLARDQVLALEGLYRQFAPAALLHAAEGARALGDWEDGERLARLAYDAATERAHAIIQQDADLLLGAIGRREPALKAEWSEAPTSTQRLVQMFAATLKACSR